MHLIGLVSDGGVHSSDRHLKALIELAAEWGIDDLVVHAFTDGRDTSPNGGAKYLAEVAGLDGGGGAGRIGSRHRALLRDGPRQALGPRAEGLRPARPRQGRAPRGHGRRAAAQAAYERDETDEFIAATTVGDEARIRPGDAVLAFNFRPDRMREITLALCDPAFDEIDRGGADVVERYATLAEYDEDWDYPVVFPPKRPAMTIGAGHRARRARASCTSPRPRSTRT